MSETKKLLVIGGMDKNIPTWITRLFEITHVEQQLHFKRIIAPADKPDLVIVLKSWISHKQCADARDYAQEHGIPFILASGGWSSVVQKAAESGLDWFVHTIDKSLETLSEEQAKETDEVITRAWESAYNREYEKSCALEKRLKKDRERLEKALIRVESAESREHAANRVILEVRAAAKAHQDASDQTRSEIRRVVDELRKKIDALLADHELSAQKHLIDIAELRKKLGKLSEI